MADCVDDDDLLAPHELEDDAVRPLSDLVEACEYSFERVELCGIKVSCEPLNSIGYSIGDGPIELLKLLRGGFENADGVQFLWVESFRDNREIFATLPLRDRFLLTDQSFAQSALQFHAVVRVAEEFNKLLLDNRGHHLRELFPGHREYCRSHDYLVSVRMIYTYFH